MNKIILLLFVSLLSAKVSYAGWEGQHEKVQFNVMVNLGYEVNNIDLSSDSIDFKNVTLTLVNKVNELAKNKKFAVTFSHENKEQGSVINLETKSDLLLNISIMFIQDETKNGVDVYYAEDNDFTFQSIKYANMVVSEIKSSRLNLKVNGMAESDLPKLKNATMPALQVDINLMNVPEDKLILTNEDKLNALARLIYGCIERISKS